MFAKGTTSAKPYAVSFYVKGNASATYTCELEDGDNSRRVAKEFSVTTDWTRVELSFPADTTGAFDDDNALSLSLNIFLHGGNNFTSGTFSANTWESISNTTRLSDSQTSFFDSTDRTFFITGVQLEVGQNPTAFEHEPFDVTRRKCFRYFQKQSYPSGTYVNVCYAYDTGSSRAVQYFTPKRATPSVISTSGTLQVYHSAGNIDDSTNQYHDIGLESCRVTVTLTGESTTAGYAMATYTTSAYDILIDAEL